VPTPSDGRVADDRCPGALRVHQAANGAMVRVRLPGGQITVRQLRALAAGSASDGNRSLDLTSRANVQIRGLADAAAATRIADRLAAAGLLPSATHERVRNVLASPLSGRDSAGCLDIRPMVAQFDAALISAPDLAALSGRFLFALDDGRGDVAALGADVCWVAGPAGAPGSLLLAGADHGLRADAGSAVPALIRAARAFLRVRADVPNLWRIEDLPDGPGRIAAELGGEREPVSAPHPASLIHWTPALGAHSPGFVVAAAPLGRLSAGQANLIAQVAASPNLVITPWRSVVLDAAADAVPRLAAGGLVLDDSSPWHGLTACVGILGCASALADVRADAAADATTRAAPPTPSEVPVHWVGCDRCCGRPAGPAVMVIATGTDYRVVGPTGEVTDGPLAQRLTLARSGG